MDIHVINGRAILLSLLIVQITATVLFQQSSPTDVDRYCSVDGNDVSCNSQYSKTFDLVEEFRNLSGQCNQNNSTCHFDNLFIHQSLVQNITSSDFGQLSFNSMHIYSAEELEWIDKDSDQADRKLLNKQLFVNRPSKLNSTSVNQLLWMYPQLVQVETALVKDISHQIPSFCRVNQQPQSDLKYLTYKPNYYEIGRIEDFAFDCLPSLQVVKLAHIPIKHIEPNAFSFVRSGVDLNVINLDDCQLNESILESVTINGTTNSVLLMLDNNFLTYLPERLQPFLDRANNVVSLYGNLLDCTQLKRHLWLLQDKPKYRDRVWGAKCETGQNLFDIELYEAKCSFNSDESVLQCTNIDSNDFDIRQEIIYLQQIMDIKLESLQLLTVSNCNIVQIPENVLNSVPVSRVQLIDLAALSRIDANAFGSGTSSAVDSLIIAGTNQLTLSNALSVVNSLSNLQYVSLSLANGNQILPTNAFGQLSHLQSIEFTPNGYRMLSIGANVIGQLSSLDYFSLGGIGIGEIAIDAFAFGHASRETLKVNLSGCGLDETKLRNRPFDQIINRPIRLDLSDNSIRVLEQEMFHFLLVNSNHVLDLAENELLCQFGNYSSPTQHPYYWIYLNRDKLSDQMLNAKCMDNTDLFEYLNLQFSKSSALPLAGNITVIWCLLVLLSGHLTILW